MNQVLLQTIVGAQALGDATAACREYQSQNNENPTFTVDIPMLSIVLSKLWAQARSLIANG
jgi:hypothetical protein